MQLCGLITTIPNSITRDCFVKLNCVQPRLELQIFEGTRGHYMQKNALKLRAKRPSHRAQPQWPCCNSSLVSNYPPCRKTFSFQTASHTYKHSVILNLPFIRSQQILPNTTAYKLEIKQFNFSVLFKATQQNKKNIERKQRDNLQKKWANFGSSEISTLSDLYWYGHGHN